MGLSKKVINGTLACSTSAFSIVWFSIVTICGRLSKYESNEDNRSKSHAFSSKNIAANKKII